MRSILVAVLVCLSTVVGAIEPIDDPRAEALFTQLRCVVCQNQSIADSDAAVAADLRDIVRTKIAEGATDDAIFDYLVERYGEFVLLRPRVRWNTLLLWGAPVLVLGAGVGALFLARRRRDRPDATALTDDEERALRALLDERTSN